jgi:sugar phosphate isomerase/epimerase
VRVGLLGLFTTDLTDVTPARAAIAAELGFHGVGAHIAVPAGSIPEGTLAAARAAIADHGLEFLQLWGRYPSLISPDEAVRRAGVAEVRALVGVTARLGVPAVGVRPTSLNPRGDWWPHPDHYRPETEDRFLRSLGEIVTAAREAGIRVVLEGHQTSVLDSARTIRRVIERSDPVVVRVNIDPCNFVTDLRTAFAPAAMLHEMFDLLGPYADTVQLKDYYLEDRLVLHVSETVIGTGLMDCDTVLQRTYQNQPDGWVVIEHLPLNLIPMAMRNLTARIRALGIPLGPGPAARGRAAG